MSDWVTNMFPSTFQLPKLAAPGPAPKVLVHTEDVLSSIAERVGSSQASSKADLVRLIQLPRSTISTQVDWLLNRGVLTHTRVPGPLKRGRPADTIALNGRAGCVVSIEVGGCYTTITLLDLAGRVLAHRRFALALSLGPEPGLDTLVRVVEELANQAGKRFDLAPRSNWVVSVALPARVDASTGSPVRPTVMPTWDGYPVADSLGAALGCPSLVENDCNVRAFGEAGHLGREALPLVTIQIGTGIGAGIVDATGAINRGANGSAGDIGHTPTLRAADQPCGCGAKGCVETVAAVPAMLKRIEPLGLVPNDPLTQGADRLADLLAQGHPEVIRTVRESAQVVGELAATLCDVLNPRRLVITSRLVSVTQDVLAVVRSVVYSRSRALATEDLVVAHSTLAEHAAVAGNYLIGRASLLSPANIRLLRAPTVEVGRGRTPRPGAA